MQTSAGQSIARGERVTHSVHRLHWTTMKCNPLHCLASVISGSKGFCDTINAGVPRSAHHTVCPNHALKSLTPLTSVLVPMVHRSWQAGPLGRAGSPSPPTPLVNTHTLTHSLTLSPHTVHLRKSTMCETHNSTPIIWFKMSRRRGRSKQRGVFPSDLQGSGWLAATSTLTDVSNTPARNPFVGTPSKGGLTLTGRRRNKRSMGTGERYTLTHTHLHGLTNQTRRRALVGRGDVARNQIYMRVHGTHAPRRFVSACHVSGSPHILSHCDTLELVARNLFGAPCPTLYQYCGWAARHVTTPMASDDSSFLLVICSVDRIFGLHDSVSRECGSTISQNIPSYAPTLAPSSPIHNHKSA
jgi:hypothetical protein